MGIALLVLFLLPQNLLAVLGALAVWGLVASAPWGFVLGLGTLWLLWDGSKIAAVAVVFVLLMTRFYGRRG